MPTTLVETAHCPWSHQKLSPPPAGHLLLTMQPLQAQRSCRTYSMCTPKTVWLLRPSSRIPSAIEGLCCRMHLTCMPSLPSTSACQSSCEMQTHACVNILLARVSHQARNKTLSFHGSRAAFHQFFPCNCWHSNPIRDRNMKEPDVIYRYPSSCRRRLAKSCELLKQLGIDTDCHLINHHLRGGHILGAAFSGLQARHSAH